MFKAMLRSIPNRIHTRFDADTSMATKGLLAFRAGIQNANKTWDELASDIRTMATVMGNMLKGALLSNITLLVPAILH